MRISVIDADTEVKEYPESLRIPIAWPCYAWKCSVPANLNPDWNILEKLILSLISKRLAASSHDLNAFLSAEIGLDPTLIEAAIDICERKGWIDRKRTGQLQLSADGKKKLEDYNATDTDASAEKKTVWLFVSATSHAVIPRFDVDSLPDGKLFDDDVIICMPKDEGNSRRFPEALQLRYAIRTWKTIVKQRNEGEPAAINPVSEPTDVSLAENEENKAHTDDTPWIPQRMADDSQMINLLGYVCVNRYKTSQLIMVSPFGKDYDRYFDQWLDRARTTNPEFDKRLREAVAERIEGASAYIAFDNSLEVPLLDDVPLLNNAPAFIELKNRIISMAKFLNKSAEEQERSFYEFGTNFRASAELLFRYVFDRHPELEQTRDSIKQIPKNQRFEQMRAYLLQSGFSLRFSDGVLNNIVQGGPSIRYSKDMIALMVIHSALHTQSIFTSYLSVTELWLAELPDIITKIGNSAAHGNSIGEHQPAAAYYQKIERLIRTTFEYLMDGGTSNG